MARLIVTPANVLILEFNAGKGFLVISNVTAQGFQKQKEDAEITFRDYLGETVLDILGNYFGETVRDILKDDFRKGFSRGFECGRYSKQVLF